jgi:hypothetical protein
MIQEQNNSIQFIHASTLANKPRGTMPSTKFVTDEVGREPYACHHIENPNKPQVLFGCTPQEVYKKLQDIVGRCKDPLKRKVRSDRQILCSGVFSMQLEATATNLQSKQFKAWVRKAHKFLLKEFGNQYVNLTLHADEGKYIHCHFFVLPSIKDGQLDISRMHPGLAAQEALKGSKPTKQKKDIAYKQAMRKFQDSFYKEVSAECGHLRYGPRRRRLTRKEWHTEKNNAKLLQKIIEAKNGRIEALKANLTRVANYFGLSSEKSNSIKNNNNNNGVSHNA